MKQLNDTVRRTTKQDNTKSSTLERQCGPFLPCSLRHDLIFGHQFVVHHKFWTTAKATQLFL